MGRVIAESPFFAIEEFAVSAAHPELVEPVPDGLRKSVERLVRGVLHPLRVEYGKPFKVLSGYRPLALNSAIGGEASSQHLYAQAADIAVPDVGELFRLAWLRRVDLDCGQIIIYPLRGFIHFATKSGRFSAPSFFMSRGPKSYVPVTTTADMEAAIA